MNQQSYVHIRLRRDSAANWTANNPILKIGEPGLETDTRKLKFGDGITAWRNLPYSGIDINDNLFLENIDDRVALLIKAGSNISINYDDSLNTLTIGAIGLQLAGDYATLVNGRVPAVQLPSYVDDVIEASNLAGLPVSGETGKIYVTLDSNKVYRWSGSTYIEIGASPGSTDSVTEGSVNLYYTNARASAAAPVQSVAGRTGIVTLTKSDVGLGNVDNTSDANKPVSTAQQTALDGKAASSHSHDKLTNSNKEFVLDNDGKLTLPRGSILSETNNTISLMPPTAVSGQSLVVRPTVALWTISSSDYIEYGNPITVSVTLNSWAYFGTVNYTISGTGVTPQSLGRALTGKLTFVSTSAPDTETITWTIPANSNITEFTLTLTSVDGTRSTNPQVDNNPALYYNFEESNGMPIGQFITVTNNGITNSEHSHVHLVAGDPSIVDIYLGDDDQYVKIEKDGGDVVVGTKSEAVVNRLTLITNGTGYAVTPNDVAVLGGSGTGMRVNYANNGDSVIVVVLNALGTGYQDGDILTLSGGNENCTFRYNNRNALYNNWTFGTDGSTTFPNGVSIDEYYGSQFPRIVADSGKAFSFQGQGSTGSAALSWMESENISSPYAAVGVSKGGGDNLANVVITAGASTPTLKVWRFDENGSITFPNGTNINSPSGQSRAEAIAITNATELLIGTNSENTNNLWTFGIDGSTILPENTLKGYCFTATNTVVNYIPQAAAFLYTDNPILRLILTIGGSWYIKGPGLVGWKQISAAQDNGGVALILRIGGGNTPLPDGSEFPSGGGNVYTISQYVEFDLKVADKTWIFKKDGKLTLPIDGDILDSNGTSVLGGGSTTVVSSSYSSTINTDAGAGDIFDITLTGNTTLSNPTNPVNGKTLRWRITQDATGSRTVALGNKFNIPSSATSPLPFSTGANKMDILAATYHAGRDKWDIVAFVPGY
jgi:hypothetical protein